MARPVVRLHRIIIRFEDGLEQEFYGDDISMMNVVKRELRSIYAEPSPGLLEALRRLGRAPLVNEVELNYRAADYVDYTTVVRAGYAGEAEAADNILVRPAQPVSVYPRAPMVIPAADILPGSTFAVARHSAGRLENASKELQAGWHRSDCTWYYPY